MLREWKDIPDFMRCDEVREYYEVLSKKKNSLRIKRCFDVTAAVILLIIFALPMLVIAILIKADSKGPVFYRQERITAYGRIFRIHKFRTMVDNADRIGTAVTVGNDVRITGIGQFLRKYRIDEIPQLIDVLEGNMSFVGTRPEALKYVKKYTKEMYATLLLPAGITSEASIHFKDEAGLLKDAYNVDEVYINKILPRKMKYNLASIKKFSLLRDLITMIRTVSAVLDKENG